MPRKNKQSAADRAAEIERTSVTVNREEWNALHALRERTEVAMATHRALQTRFDELLAVNAAQLSRLTDATMRIDHMRVCLIRSEEREKLLSARAVHLETLLQNNAVKESAK